MSLLNPENQIFIWQNEMSKNLEHLLWEWMGEGGEREKKRKKLGSA